jgi:hypothetical protein
MSQDTYQPDFQAECRICSSTPCVIVVGHPQGNTDLCGVCFFGTYQMTTWTEWNNDQDNDL